jgi:hypothetical protein
MAEPAMTEPVTAEPAMAERVTAERAGVEPAGVARRTRRKGRRWLRLVIPFAVVVTLIVGSAIVYALQLPDPGDPAYLSPVSDAPTGSSRLAGMLRQRGVLVERQTRTSDALVSAYQGEAILFIPTPGLVHPFYLRMLKLLPASTRVVLVAPGARALAGGRLPVGVADQRWAPAAPEPGCTHPAAQQAGRATALWMRFTDVDPVEATLYRCYSGGLVGARWYRTALDLIGADDPFRNDRIGEFGNAALATGLLSGARRVVWLDLHRQEPRPGYVDDPRAAANGPAPPSLGPGSPDPDFPIGDTGPDPGQPQGRPGQGAGGGDAGGTGAGAESTDPLWTAFPTTWYVAAALLLLAALLLALARARRLGTPVPEPLPVTVRATETVEGRGRLYSMAKARGPALATLRSAAEQRLVRLLGLAPDAGRDSITEAVAAHTGTPRDEVDSLLYGPEPADDTELVRSATTLDRLLRAVGPQQLPHEGEPR